MSSRTVILVLTPLLLTFAGCTPASRDTVEGTNSTTAASVTADPSGESADTGDKSRTETVARPEAGIDLQVGDWDDVQRLREKARGKVVVVDLWSTSCVPCVREFPNLVRLQREFPERVTCISFNLDYYGGAEGVPESMRDRVLEFLKKRDATIVNVMSSEPDEAVYEKLDLAAIPAVYVYGPDGELARRFDNEDNEYGEEGFTYDGHITPLVESLLGDGSR